MLDDSLSSSKFWPSNMDEVSVENSSKHFFSTKRHQIFRKYTFDAYEGNLEMCIARVKTIGIDIIFTYYGNEFANDKIYEPKPHLLQAKNYRMT